MAGMEEGGSGLDGWMVVVVWVVGGWDSGRDGEGR